MYINHTLITIHYVRDKGCFVLLKYRFLGIYQSALVRDYSWKFKLEGIEINVI